MPGTDFWQPPDTSAIRLADTGYVDLPLFEPDCPDGLFPEPPRDLSRAPLTAEKIRTRRALDRLAAARHPLTDGPLHPAAPIAGNVTDPASRYDRYPRPFTCGTCAHLATVPRGPEHSEFKCGLPGAPMSFGPATSLRRWWPACDQYQPNRGDPADAS